MARRTGGSEAAAGLVLAFAVAAAMLAATGCTWARQGGGAAPRAVAPQPRYPAETAPAELLKPETIGVGLGTPGAPDTQRVNNGFLTAFSPDSKLLAVVGGRTDDPQPGLWVAAADGAKPRRLIDAALSAVFSPDGTMIAATVPGADGSLAVGLVPAQGGTLTTVAGQAVAPVWSPDGRAIAYLSAKDIEAQTFTIGVKYLGEGMGSGGLNVPVDAVAPVWAGDGTIYYVGGSGGGSHQLYSVALGNGIRSTVTSPTRGDLVSPRRLTTLKGRIEELSIAKDGSKVAFLEVVTPSQQDTTEGISTPAVGRAYVYSTADGALARPLGDRLVTHPRLAPDGRRLWAGVEGGAIVADVSVGELGMLSKPPGRRGNPGFVPIARRRSYLPNPSPDGKRLTVISPSSDVAAVLLDVKLGVLAGPPTYLVATDEVTPTVDPEPALEKLIALEPTSLDTTEPAFPPGYPDAFSWQSLAGLPAGKTIVAAGRFGWRPDADALAARLGKGGMKPQVITLK